MDSFIKKNSYMATLNIMYKTLGKNDVGCLLKLFVDLQEIYKMYFLDIKMQFKCN